MQILADAGYCSAPIVRKLLAEISIKYFRAYWTSRQTDHLDIEVVLLRYISRRHFRGAAFVLLGEHRATGNFCITWHEIGIVSFLETTAESIESTASTRGAMQSDATLLFS